LKAIFVCFKGSSSPVEPSRWQRAESPGQEKNNTNVYDVKNFIIKKQSNIIKLEAFRQKGNPWKAVSFQGVNRGLKGEWNGNIPYILKFIYYYNVGCQALSHDRRFKAFSVERVLPHNE